MPQLDPLPQLDAARDMIRLAPQIVGRFYGDLNRLSQRQDPSHSPTYYQPERWIGSSTEANNPPPIPSGGLSRCPAIVGPDDQPITLRNLLAHPEAGPRLLGQRRHDEHGGQLRLLVKLLDAACPIPLHVHAADEVVGAHPDRFPGERFGKDEAYHFLPVEKGPCPYTHIGLYPGVDARDILLARQRGTDALLELSPASQQRFGEGFVVPAGLLHRPGTALTLEIQQPSDVYTMVQTDFGGEPLPDEALHPGFDHLEQALEHVVNWSHNLRPNLLEELRLIPQPTELPGVQPTDGAVIEWIFPPRDCRKFSGLRIEVPRRLTLRFQDPCILFIWEGRGRLQDEPVEGTAGKGGAADEFFLGQAAVQAGLELVNQGEVPLVAFALFPAELEQ